jgi:hypothetical protein
MKEVLDHSWNSGGVGSARDFLVLYLLVFFLLAFATRRYSMIAEPQTPHVYFEQ